MAGKATTDSIQADTISNKAGTGSPSFPNGLTGDIQSDSITDALGTGAPDFPNGFTNNGTAPEIKFQQKYLTASSVSPETMADLTFNNLTIGKSYKITTSAVIDLNVPSGATEYILVDVKNGSTILSQIVYRADATSSDLIQMTKSSSVVFTATSTTTTVGWSETVTNASTQVLGGQPYWTFCHIEELPYHTVTTDFT